MPPKLSVDPELVRRLAELLVETGLGEIEYAEGDRRIRIARPAPAAAAPVSIAAPSPVTITAPAAPAAASEGPPANAVTSPMVGTVYLSPEPGAPAFINVGDKVKEGQTLLIIEAMKVMNQIRSPRAGTVSKIFVANGAPVEYGEPMLAID
ncbi:MAG TPA: acetyl-CoA carboxylase biotin carboxyl carrier protein [Dongiaceae bacterium]|nr:acetyl-CoA carboxylase biotin carboxyl carrier protein [Dongiaceae bacterium]